MYMYNMRCRGAANDETEFMVQRGIRDQSVAISAFAAAIPSAVPELDTSTVLPFRNDTYVAEMRSRGAAVTCHFGTRLVRALAVNGTHMVCPVPLHHEAPFRLTLGAFASSAAPRVVGGGEASGVAAL